MFNKSKKFAKRIKEAKATLTQIGFEWHIMSKLDKHLVIRELSESEKEFFISVAGCVISALKEEGTLRTSVKKKGWFKKLFSRETTTVYLEPFNLQASDIVKMNKILFKR